MICIARWEHFDDDDSLICMNFAELALSPLYPMYTYTYSEKIKIVEQRKETSKLKVYEGGCRRKS